MSFTDAIKSVFTQYATFTGRARRSEFWYFFLFNWLVSTALGIIYGATGSTFFSILVSLWSLAVLVPTLALDVRRLHDTGRSGWKLLWVLLPIAGVIILLVYFCENSSPVENSYGPCPKAM